LHHTRLFQTLFRGSFSTIPQIAPKPKPETTIYDTLKSWLPGYEEVGDEKEKKRRAEMSSAEKKLRKGRWAWYIGAAGAMVGYLLLSGLVQVGRVGDGTFEEDEQDDEEEEEIVEEIGPESEIVVVEVVEPEVVEGDAVA
jgi:hypothetical protein